MKKQVTSSFTNKDGVINYSTDVNYWDEKKGKYRLFSSKDRISIYRDNDLIEAFPKYEDLGRLFKLVNSMDANNMIGIYNKHLKHYAPVTNKVQLYALLGIKSRTTGAAFYQKLKDLDIIKEWHDDEGRTVFYINPVYTMADRGITLTVYKLFYDALNKVLPYKAKESLQALCSNPAADNSQVVSYDDADNVFIDGRLYHEIDNEIAASSDEDKQAIFDEYILHDRPAKTYQKIGKGMIAHQMTDANDTYFLPNQSDDYKATKPKNEDITEYRSWFLDIDAGRDEDGKYFSLDKVVERKAKMIEVINALPTPTAVIDTRNGYHVYFACYGVSDANQWQQLQDLLIESAKIADPAVRDAARLLRLPGSVWIKAHTGLAPYPVSIIAANKQAYDAASFSAQLDMCADKAAAAAKAYNVSYPMAVVKKSRTAAAGTGDITKQSARVQSIADLSIDTFTLSTSMTTIDNINAYLKQVNLADFLQISNPSSFNCILHDDHNPSATIYQNESGYRYYCASTCAGHGDGHGADIVDIVMILSSCSYKQAINYLCRICGIRQQSAA